MPESEYLSNMIRRVDGFEDLYADTGIAEPEAPGITRNVKFTASADYDTLAAVREFDRKRGGYE